MKKIISLLLLAITISSTAFAREPHRGYRGFLDVNNSIWFVSDQGMDRTTYYFGLSTSHGYQFNPWLFIGGGLEFNVAPGKNDSNISPFAQGRFDFSFGKFKPFGDFRLGYNLANGGGMFISPTIGYRFDWGRRVCLNLGIGLSSVGYAYDLYEIITHPDGDGGSYNELVNTGKKHSFQNFLTIRVGIEF